MRIVALTIGLALPSAGCMVRVYQPMSGLHQPAVVDPQLPNFRDVNLTVHCVPGDLLTPMRARTLCQKVSSLFEIQGAEVTTITTVGRSTDAELREKPELADDEEPRTELFLELRARQVHADYHLLSWAACAATFTLVPGVFETTFAQDVIVRDSDNYLLASTTLQGRLITQFGVAIWASNQLLDANLRKKKDKILKVSMTKDLSDDLYRQLSQILFNAKIQSEVLQEAGSMARGVR